MQAPNLEKGAVMGRTKKSACWFCYQNCGVLVQVKNGIVESVSGDPSHPISRGARCPRNYAWKEFLDHPERINYPLRRDGKRGEGKWKRITWNQALDEIATKLKEIKEGYGAEALVSCGGTNRTDDWARRRFFNLFGSPNILHPDAVCGLDAFMIECAIHGWGVEPSFAGSKLIVIWGHNSAVSYIPEIREILDAKEQGAKIMVIDPRYTETAKIADHWLQIRPGSDGTLALSWINVIINEELYDKDFVDKYTYGFDELKKHVQMYTPEWAERLTWLPKDTLIDSARAYATAKPACITWGVAPDHLGRSCKATIQARAILRAITGNLDIDGGNLISGPHPSFITDWELELNEVLPLEQREKQIGSDRFKLLAWPGYELLSEQAKKYWGKAMPAERTCQAHAPSVWRAILTEEPYPVKGMIVLASNPVVSYANSKLIYNSLKSDNLEILVVMDYWMTPTAELADFVLPAAFWLERPVLSSFFGLSRWFIANERGIEPLYERKTDYEFWSALGRKLGQAEYWPWKSLGEVNTYRISPLGYNSYEQFIHELRMHIAPGDLRKYVERGFGTPTGKVEVYSTILEKLGYDPLPTYEESRESPFSSPIVARKYPLILITGNFMPYHHSELRQIKIMRRLVPEPMVEIHPSTASKLGVKEGDWANIETRRGQVKMRVTLSWGLHPRVVFAQKGWWFPEEPGREPCLHGLWKSNINVCTDDEPDCCDQVTGGWIYKSLLCKITKA